MSYPQHRQSENESILYFNLGLITLLVIFDTEFSKFQLIGPLYLHDALLVLGAGISLILCPRKFPFTPILAILGIASLYLVYSFYHYSSGTQIIVRQFALFGYLGCYYLLNRDRSANQFHIIKKFLTILSYGSIVIQTLYVIFLVLSGTYNTFDFHNWYSHALVLGLIIASATILVSDISLWIKCAGTILVMFLCWTTGHASAQLAVLAVVVSYILLFLKSWKKLIPIAGGIVVTLALLGYAPQFKDKNTDWRLLTWGYLMDELIRENYLVTGKGFGVAYTSKELEEYLYKQISSTAIKERGKPDERYITPSHNSFITIFFAIGIIPGLLIFAPYRHFVRLGFQAYNPQRKFEYMLLLSLAGLSLWVSFNVVLELPHSAGLFWLVYFTFWKSQEPIPAGSLPS